MLYNEFEELTGIQNVNVEYYTNVIEPMYMATNMDKREFCEAYKNAGNLKLCEELLSSVKQLQNTIDKIAYELDSTKCDLLYYTRDIIKKSCSENDNKLYELAINLIGNKKCVEIKIDENLPFNEIDKKYIKTILQNQK